MNTLRRNKREIYHCKKYIEDGIEKYYEPINKELNYQPITSSAERAVIGDTYKMYLKINCTKEDGLEFSAGDKCYINETVPETYDILCSKADYIVDSMPIITLNDAEVMLRKTVGE